MSVSFNLLDPNMPANIAGSVYAGQQQRQQNELAKQQAQMRQQEMGMRQQEIGMRQQGMAEQATERQRLLANQERRTTFLRDLGQKLAEGGKVLDRPTLGEMISSGIPEVEKLGFEGIKSLDEQQQFEEQMGRIAPKAEVAPAGIDATAPSNAFAPAATPTNALTAGYSRPQIEQMLISSNPKIRDMGKNLLGALPKPVAEPAEIAAMRALGLPLTQAGYQKYRDAQRQERMLSPEEEAQRVRIAAASRAPAQPRAEQPPVAVVDPVTGKQVLVSREEALRGRMTPAAAMESLPPKEIQKREAVLPQATSAVQGFESKAEKFIADLTALKNHPGLSSITGIAAGRMPGLTAEGRAAQALYDKVVAKGGFQALQDLRDASKTGGALGNVSNQEGKQLTASFAAIDRRQNAFDVQAALDQAIADIQGSKTRMREAYDATYAYKSGTELAAKPAPVTLSPADKQALDWANSNPKDPRALQIKQRLGQ